MVKRSSSLLVLVLLGASALVSAPAPAAAADFEVKVGALYPGLPATTKPYAYTRFYPETLQVHEGQTVRWTFHGNPVIQSAFHTVTFSRVGKPPLLREDDVSNTFAVPNQWFFGTGCGRDGQAPCVWDDQATFISSGTGVMESGPFEVTFDAPPGVYAYFCTVHPAMTGTVEVVGDEAPLKTKAEIAAMVEDQIATDSENADAVFQAGQLPSATNNSDGTKTWRVRIGDSTLDDHVSIVAYLPSSIAVAQGDSIEWYYDDHVVNEVHTVSFTTRDLSQTSIYPSCDFDDPDGGAKGVPGLWGLVGPPCPANMEFAMAPWMTEPQPAPGGLILVDEGLWHESGMVVPQGSPHWYRDLPGTDRELPFTTSATFPAQGSFEYRCNIHFFGMTGSVAVTEG